MKILIVANNDVGLYKFRKELLQTLVKQHDVYISLPDGPFVPTMIELGCKYIPCGFDRHGTNPVKEFCQVAAYKKLIKEIRPDMVFTYTIKPNVYAGMACAALKIPYAANVTGLGNAIENGGILQILTLGLYKFGLRKAQTVFFQNGYNREFFIKKRIIKSDNVLLPGSGVNLDEHCYEPYPADDGTLRFLFVGRIMKDKGIDELIECAKTIHKKYPHVQFDLIGDYDDEKYKTQLEELQANNTLNYYGFQKNVHDYVKTHHATILPSYHEGIANVLLESAACGRPVIATDVPGCRETFDDGVSGFSCKAKSADDLIRAVEKFIALPYTEKENMGFAGRNKVENEFNRQIVVNAYLNELNKINRG